MKKEYFELFKYGQKVVEYRPPLKKWEQRHFPINRPVILSCGYNGERINAQVEEWYESTDLSKAFKRIYGDRYDRMICIKLKICQDQIQEKCKDQLILI